MRLSYTPLACWCGTVPFDWSARPVTDDYFSILCVSRTLLKVRTNNFHS
jgi:hypothetical protein